MQDWQNGPVGRGIKELVAVPRGRQRSGLRFAVADDASNDQIGIVEGGAKRMQKRITQFTTFMD